MLDRRIIEHLNDKHALLPEEKSQKYSDFLKLNDFDPDSAFFQFMSSYSDDWYGNADDVGHFSDVMDILMDNGEWNLNRVLHEKENVPQEYITMEDASDWLFLYNKKNDSVVILEDGSVDRLLNKDFDYYWSSFNDFLLYFFGLAD